MSEYAIDLRVTPYLRDDPAFSSAEAEAYEQLEVAGIGDPQDWVFNRVARAVTQARPLSPVTDDFIAFSFVEGFGAELEANLRFSGGQAIELIEARGLLPSAA